MVRRRTATLSLTAAALVLAAPLITSCGAEHPGSAAVVGGHTITVTALQNSVNQLRAAQTKAGQQADLSGEQGGLNRMILTKLLGERVLDQAAADHGVTVTRREVKALEAANVKRLNGTEAMRDILMQQEQVAPGAPTDAFFRSLLQKDGIARAIGADLTTPQGGQALTAELAKTARTLHVDVNPRYGSWSVATGTIGDATSAWLHPGTDQQQPAAVTG